MNLVGFSLLPFLNYLIKLAVTQNIVTHFPSDLKYFFACSCILMGYEILYELSITLSVPFTLFYLGNSYLKLHQ